jgi:hypothetical protein
LCWGHVWSPAQFAEAFPLRQIPVLDNHPDFLTPNWVVERYSMLRKDVDGWLEKSGEALHGMKENTTK